MILSLITFTLVLISCDIFANCQLGTTNLKANMVLVKNDFGEEDSFRRFKYDSVISCASLIEFIK